VLQYGCGFVIDINDKSFQKLGHYKMHEENARLFAFNDSKTNGSSNAGLNDENEPSIFQPLTQTYPTGTTLTSIDGFPIFKRKRGRPPKNKTEVYRFTF